MARSVKLEHKRAAHHIAKGTVLLHPVPCPAKPAGKVAAAVARVIRNESADESDILLCNRFASIAQYRFHVGALSTTWETGTQVLGTELLQFSEKLDHSGRGVEVPDKRLKLVGIDLALLRPTGNTAAGEPLVAEPKPLTVIAKDPEGGPRSVAENEKDSAERVGIERLPADAAQSVDAGPKVNGIYANQDAHLGSDLDHRPWLMKRSIK